ncbi:MAG: sulfatase family protein [Planctomycetota bacterium]|jgi:arylsulfatase A-like enzyme
MNRREFLSRSGMAVAGLGVSQIMNGKKARAGSGGLSKCRGANVLLITCHDLGRHLGCYGIDTVNTNNIDALAANGSRFRNYFSTDCVCSPSRGSFLTGRYPQSNGLMGLTHKPWGWSLNEGEKHLAAILRDTGYETTLVGLQHVTSGDPRELGYNNVLSQNDKADETVKSAREFLLKAGRADRPFYLEVGFFEVHRPFTEGKDTEKGVFIPDYLKDTPEIREDLARFQGAIRFFDRCVGEILDALKQSQAAEKTLIVFTSDHGIPYPGAKWSLYEPGIEIPLIMSQSRTALQGGKVYHQLMSNVDFLPTLLDLLGVGIPANLQGFSFKEVIEGTKAESPRREIFAQRTSHALRDNTSRAIRTDRYKLIRYFEPGRVIEFPTDAVPQGVAGHTVRPKRKPGQRPVVQLFDLKDDPHERNNLAALPEHAGMVRDLSNRLWRWMEQVGDPILKGPLVTPYYRQAIRDYHRYRNQAQK